MKKILCLILHISSLFAAQENNGPLLVQPAAPASPEIPAQTIPNSPQSGSPNYATPLASPTNAHKTLNPADAPSPLFFSRVFSQDLDETTIEAKHNDDRMEQEKKAHDAQHKSPAPQLLNPSAQPAQKKITQKPSSPDISDLRNAELKNTQQKKQKHRYVQQGGCWGNCKDWCFTNCCPRKCPQRCKKGCNPYMIAPSPAPK
jgi:hypothetical protein